MIYWIFPRRVKRKLTGRQLVMAVYKPSTLSSRFSLFLTALPLLTTSSMWLLPLTFLIFTFLFLVSAINVKYEYLCLSVARNGVVFERISILTKYHLGFAAKKVLENGDEDMKIPLWASLKTREVKMNSAVWAFGWPHACRHGGTFSNQVGTFKSIIFNAAQP